MLVFLKNETGAATADFAVLGAGSVGLGLAAFGVASQGAQDLSLDVKEQLSTNAIHDSFTKVDHQNAYNAGVALFETTDEYDGYHNADEWFYSYMEYLDSLSDADLIALANQLQGDAPATRSQVQALKALDGEGVTASEIALAIGEDAELIQLEMDTRFIRANATFTDYREAVGLKSLGESEMALRESEKRAASE